jgi:hypothetical protein
MIIQFFSNYIFKNKFIQLYNIIRQVKRHLNYNDIYTRQDYIRLRFKCRHAIQIFVRLDVTVSRNDNENQIDNHHYSKDFLLMLTRSLSSSDSS